MDRDATLKQAEKLLRQGRLEGAIAEYVRLVEDQPRDWTSINTLGDLYVRAGQIDRAVEQFSRIGDFLFGEGFLPKAAALYKKALKVKADHDHTLLRLSEIAARQGLLADARTYLRHLERLRRSRGDDRGATECAIRLGTLDEADGDTRLAAARAAQSVGDVPQAIALFTAAAEEFSKAGKRQDALAAMAEAATLDASNVHLRNQLAREYVAAGDFERARPFLTREAAGSDPDLLLALARMELASGNDAEARLVLTRFLAVAPQRAGDLLALASELAGAGHADIGFSCVDIVIDDALLASDWERALGAVRQFLERGPHIPALMKLVELAVDAGRDDVMFAAQEQLADAYLAAGRGAEARVIAEDLFARDPSSEIHERRLRQALGITGSADADAVIGRYREMGEGGDIYDFDWKGPVDPGHARDASLAETRDFASGPAEAGYDKGAESVANGAVPVLRDLPAGLGEDEDDAVVLDVLEIDLSELLAGLGGGSPAASPPASPPDATDDAPPPDLESVFEHMRSRAAEDGSARDAAEEYERALRYVDEGRMVEAMADLQSAARAPQFRFRAAARLGRLYAGRGDLQSAVDWLERAAEAPAPTPEDGSAVLYELAATLERAGEHARALAVFMELDADTRGYRDVPDRIDQLTRAQAGSRSR